MGAHPETRDDPTRSARSGIVPRWLVDPARQVGKYLVNPLVLTFAGRLGPYAVVRHVGRRSGRAYSTPVWAASLGDDFVVALIIGTEADWFRNVRATGHCTLQLRGISYAVTAPEVIDQAAALHAFPVPIRLVGRLLRMRQFLRLCRAGATSRR
jgi:deazaflavin-dependent oxidoreductase (nitroreductase family)